MLLSRDQILYIPYVEIAASPKAHMRVYDAACSGFHGKKLSYSMYHSPISLSIILDVNNNAQITLSVL